MYLHMLILIYGQVNLSIADSYGTTKKEKKEKENKKALLWI